MAPNHHTLKGCTMIDVRKFGSLGHADHGWLDARHHFSFANYYDPARIGWGDLLVWNDDKIEAGKGFGRHGHKDMEIITYVRTGAVTHRDSMNNEGRTKAGDVQVMSAGTGVQHEEWNLEDKDTTLFQLWIKPNKAGLKPSWDQASFPKSDRLDRLVALASGEAKHAEDALYISQDATVYGATLAKGKTLTHELGDKRIAYLVPAKGRVKVNGVDVEERAGAAITNEHMLTIEAEEDSELLLVDLPPHKD